MHAQNKTSTHAQNKTSTHVQIRLIAIFALITHAQKQDISRYKKPGSNVSNVFESLTSNHIIIFKINFKPSWFTKSLKEAHSSFYFGSVYLWKQWTRLNIPA